MPLISNNLTASNTPEKTPLIKAMEKNDILQFEETLRIDNESDGESLYYAQDTFRYKFAEMIIQYHKNAMSNFIKAIQISIMLGNETAFLYFVSYTNMVNSRDFKIDAQWLLNTAAKFGNGRALKKLIALGIDVNQNIMGYVGNSFLRDLAGQSFLFNEIISNMDYSFNEAVLKSALMEVCINGTSTSVRSILERLKKDELSFIVNTSQYANTGTFSSRKTFPLHETLRSETLAGHKLEKISLLLEAGASVYLKDSTDKDAIDLAVEQNIIQTLLNHPHYQLTPAMTDKILSYAVQKNNGFLCEDLLKKAAALKLYSFTQIARTTFENGNNLIQFALNIDNMEMMKYFIEAGVSLNHLNKEGDTPLAAAIRKDNAKAIKILQGYTTFVTTEAAASILAAAIESNIPERVQFILNKAKENDQLDLKKMLNDTSLYPNKQLPLALAVSNKSIDLTIVKELVNAGANPNHEAVKKAAKNSAVAVFEVLNLQRTMPIYSLLLEKIGIKSEPQYQQKQEKTDNKFHPL